MPAQLLSLSSGPNILLDKPILLLGRHPECDIQIDSRKISRRHCCIAQVGEYLVVRDLGSMNGIRIDGERVLEGRLNEGAELTIGINRYRVTWDAAALENPERQNVNGKHVPARLESAEDDLLESCDDPVALPEPPVPVRPMPIAPPPIRSLSPYNSDLPPILPSDLHLAPPGSDVMHGVDSHPPI